MNEMTRVLSPRAISATSIWSQVFSKHFIGLLLLILSVIFSALGVVYVKQLNRQLFIQAELLQGAGDKLHTKWGQLLLEQSTWSTQARIQQVAQNRFNMEIPAQKNIVMVQLDSK